MAVACIAPAWFALPSIATAEDPCATARSALTDHDLLEARRQLLTLQEHGQACAKPLLKRVRQSQSAADELLGIGDKLAAADPSGARAAYAEAVALDKRSPAIAKLKTLDQPAEEGACQRAADLFEEGFVAQAKAEYLGRQEEGKACAKEGLDKVTQREQAVGSLIAVGEGLREADHEALARGVFKQAVELDQESAAAAEALETVDGPDTFRRAEKQGDDWLDDLEQLGTWLGAALAWTAAGLVVLLFIAWLARALQAAARGLDSRVHRFPPGRVAIVAAAAVGVAIAVFVWQSKDLAPALIFAVAAGAAALFMLVNSARAAVFRLLLQVNDFTTGKESKADAEGLTAQVAASISGGPNPVSSVDRAGVADAADPLGDIATSLSSVAPGKIAGALLKLLRTLLPSRTVHVTGHVHAEVGADWGLSLTVVEGRGHVVGALTLWADDYGAPASEPNEDTLRRLALAGATWVRYQLHREYGLPFVEGMSSMRSWESEALYQTAAGIRGASVETRQGLYASALESDPANRAALFDSAVLDLRSGDVEKAQRRLEFVAKETGDVLWLKATYQLAVVALQAAPPDQHRRRKAVKKAYSLACAALLDLLEKIGAAPSKAPDAAELAELRRLEGPALVFMASILLTAHSRRGLAGNGGGDWRKTLLESLKAVEDPYQEPSRLTARDLLTYAQAADVVLTDRTHYNLACFGSRWAGIVSGDARAEALDDSLRELGLALALQDSDLIAWAGTDTGLEKVRTARPDAFGALTSKAHASELAAIHAIGPKLAAKLEANHAISTAKALAAMGPNARTRLASELHVSRQLVDRWAGLAWLRSLPQLTTDYVNLLDEAGVRSRSELRNLDGDKLRRRLALASGLRTPPATLPGPALLDLWLLEAMHGPGGNS